MIALMENHMDQRTENEIETVLKYLGTNKVITLNPRP